MAVAVIAHTGTEDGTIDLISASFPYDFRKASICDEEETLEEKINHHDISSLKLAVIYLEMVKYVC